MTLVTYIINKSINIISLISVYNMQELEICNTPSTVEPALVVT